MAVHPTVILVGLGLLLSPVAWGTEVCVPIDMTGWTPTQRHSLEGLACAVSAQVQPTPHVHPVIRQGRVCLTDPPPLVVGAMTTARLQQQWNEDRQRDADANAAEVAARTSRRTKLKALGLTEAELDAAP